MKVYTRQDVYRCECGVLMLAPDGEIFRCPVCQKVMDHFQFPEGVLKRDRNEIERMDFLVTATITQLERTWKNTEYRAFRYGLFIGTAITFGILLLWVAFRTVT